MYEYRHGGNVRFEPGGEGFLDFSANINPMGIPDGVEEAISREIAACCRYPDHQATTLRESIAAFERVDPDEIFCGNGASDIIFRLPLCVRPRTGLTLCPTFSDYARAFDACGCEVARHKLDETRGFVCSDDVFETLERVRPGMMFFCNPNNPTGTLTEGDFFKRLLNRCAAVDCVLVVDECFIDFARQADAATAKRFLRDYKNLVVIKALTKTFALPGLRIGYVMSGNRRLIEKLYAAGPDWAVSNLAQAAGIAALRNSQPYLEKTVAMIDAEKNFLTQSLQRLGYRVFASAANFLLIKCPYPFDLRAKLDAHKIRVRAFRESDGLDETFYRIAVLDRSQNDRLVKCVERITSESAVRS